MGHECMGHWGVSVHAPSQLWPACHVFYCTAPSLPTVLWLCRPWVLQGMPFTAAPPAGAGLAHPSVSYPPSQQAMPGALQAWCPDIDVRVGGGGVLRLVRLVFNTAQAQPDVPLGCRVSAALPALPATWRASCRCSSGGGGGGSSSGHAAASCRTHTPWVPSGRARLSATSEAGAQTRA